MPVIARLTKWIGIAGLALLWCAPATEAQNTTAVLRRVIAQTTANDGNLIALFDTSTGTPIGPLDGGVNIFSNTVAIPAGPNVMYITFAGTAFGPECGSVTLKCEVDGADCVFGQENFFVTTLTGETGWVQPAGTAAPQEFQDIDRAWGESNANYSWCLPIGPGTHQIDLAAAAFDILDPDEGICEGTALENVTVYVDVSKVPDPSMACTSYATPNPVGFIVE
jgi:hypothetical protein